VLLLCGIAAAMLALARLALAGFAPGGHPPLLVLAAYGCGLMVMLLSGQPPPSGIVTGAQTPQPRPTGAGWPLPP
jgi:hypothetical protein